MIANTEHDCNRMIISDSVSRMDTSFRNTSTGSLPRHDSINSYISTGTSSSEDEDNLNSNSNSTSMKISSPSPSTQICFPWKLHRILDDADSKGFNHIIAWVPTQNGFKVHKTKEFDEEIMPKYFDKTKYKSFQRQLDMWGFDRVGRGPYKGAYLHSCFIRNEPQLCKQMKRVKIKGVLSKKLRRKQDLSGGSNHSHSSHSCTDPLGREPDHSTSSSAPLPDIDYQLHIKRAAQKVADLEQQKAEIQRKLEKIKSMQMTSSTSSTLSQTQILDEDAFQPLPLDHHSFYNEDFKFSNRSRRRTGHRFSLELKGPDSDEHILKEEASDFLMPRPLVPTSFGLVDPMRRYSLLGTPVHNPFEMNYERPSIPFYNSNLNPQNLNINI